MSPRANGKLIRASQGARTSRAVLAGVVLACAIACGEAPPRPHVLLVTIDTLRSDHLGAYGYALPTSRNLDRLAREGALFEVAYAPTGATGPSHATLFTSRHPLTHRVERNGLVLSPNEQTLAEILQQAGYETAAFVSSYPLTRRYGLDQGFAHFDERFDAENETLHVEVWDGKTVEGAFDRRGSATVRAALRWLGARSAPEPLFLWVHLFDPHGPYAPPLRFAKPFLAPEQDERERERALYDAEIAYTDAMLGRLVEGFEAWAGEHEALLIVTADHGEGLWDHGWRKHNRYLYEEETRVPLIWRWRGRIPAGGRIAQAVHLADVAPTLLSALDLPYDRLPFEGRDLGRMLQGDADSDDERPVWLQSPVTDPSWGPRFAVRVGRWKLIEWQSGRSELYDLALDPGERQDLAGREPAVREELRERLSQWREAAARAPDPVERLDERDTEALRALGYLEKEAGR